MATALFILGHAASGKTTLARNWVKSRLRKNEAWCMMDKGDSGDILAPELMKALGMNPYDRDSKEYKEKVRDLEYLACINVAKEQLKLGINVVFPGPWTKELKNETLFNPYDMGLPEDTKIATVYLDIPENVLKERIEHRKNIRDKWKLENWKEFALTLKRPSVIDNRKILTFQTNYFNDERERLIEQEIYKAKKIKN